MSYRRDSDSRSEWSETEMIKFEMAETVTESTNTATVMALKANPKRSFEDLQRSDSWSIPFSFGWRREIVYRRTQGSNKRKTPAADVYYFSPSGEKFRSPTEIDKFLKLNRDTKLTTQNFTFKTKKINQWPNEVCCQASKRGRRSSRSQFRTNYNIENINIEKQEFSTEEQQTIGPELDRTSCFPGNYGPVVEVCVASSYLYVAYGNYGVHVYSLDGYKKKAVHKITNQDLQCMVVSELQGLVVIGSGRQLSLCKVTLVNEGPNIHHHDQCCMHTNVQNSTFDMTSTVNCLLLIAPSLVYCGLASGDISVINIVKNKKKEEYKCSDQPIMCLTSPEETSPRLLCALTRDGKVLVISTLTKTVITTLLGHSQSVFNLCVKQRLLYGIAEDSTVIAHKIYSGEKVNDVITNNKLSINCIHYNADFLYTASSDRLIRCYDVKTGKLTHVYYGANRKVISKILVYKNMLITANATGTVDWVAIDHTAENYCQKVGCNFNFGNVWHLFWHETEEHSTPLLTSTKSV
ncbi:zinc finger protein 106 isoform X2 [Biomphalaria glabrata]|nr:zinc finger protein 106 isoform X2 [Biomphalaria glabrata]